MRTKKRGVDRLLAFRIARYEGCIAQVLNDPMYKSHGDILVVEK